jgi:hypothetical protein
MESKPEPKPFSENQLERLKQIISAHILASAETVQAVKSPKYLVRFYMDLLVFFHRNYIQEAGTVSIPVSYRELSQLIKQGPLCWYKDKRRCPYERHTLAKYVSLLVSLNFATETASGFALRVPYISFNSALPLPAPMPPRAQRFSAPKKQSSKVKAVDPEPPTTAPAPPAPPEPTTERYAYSEQIPELREYLRRHHVEAAQWEPLSVGEREAWLDRFSEVLGTEEYYDIAETVRAQQPEDEPEPTIVF